MSMKVSLLTGLFAYRPSFLLQHANKQRPYTNLQRTVKHRGKWAFYTYCLTHAMHGAQMFRCWNELRTKKCLVVDQWRASMPTEYQWVINEDQACLEYQCLPSINGWSMKSKHASSINAYRVSMVDQWRASMPRVSMPIEYQWLINEEQACLEYQCLLSINGCLLSINGWSIKSKHSLPGYLGPARSQRTGRVAPVNTIGARPAR